MSSSHAAALLPCDAAPNVKYGRALLCHAGAGHAGAGHAGAMCAMPGRGELQGGLDKTKLRNLEIFHKTGNPTLRKDLMELKLESFNSVLILADESNEASASSVQVCGCVNEFSHLPRASPC